MASLQSKNFEMYWQIYKKEWLKEMSTSSNNTIEAFVTYKNKNAS